MLNLFFRRPKADSTSFLNIDCFVEKNRYFSCWGSDTPFLNTDQEGYIPSMRLYPSSFPLIVHVTLGVCPLMISMNNGDWFSTLISLLDPVTLKKARWRSQCCGPLSAYSTHFSPSMLAMGCPLNSSALVLSPKSHQNHIIFSIIQGINWHNKLTLLNIRRKLWGIWIWRVRVWIRVSTG
jgi:hypothetical protein